MWNERRKTCPEILLCHNFQGLSISLILMVSRLLLRQWQSKNLFPKFSLKKAKLFFNSLIVCDVNLNTVKPLLNPKFVAVFDRWSLFRGSFLLWELKLGPQNCGRCRQVVVIRRWSLTQVWLYFLRSEKSGLTLINFCSKTKKYCG